MGDAELLSFLNDKKVSPVRANLARWVESNKVQYVVIATILFNAIVLGLETNQSVMTSSGSLLLVLDKLCLVVFIAEMLIKLFAYRGYFWKSGWNFFDLIVISIALIPGAGVWAVLRSLRVLRVLRLLTVVPSLRKVVAAFIHALPGLGGVMTVMAIFFYTTGVLATRLFGEEFDAWFGTLGRSLYTLFQIMTLESWSMGIVRPVMEVYPLAFAFFIPFIVIATFTILNLFIGIIVSTMQELSLVPEPVPNEEVKDLLQRIDKDMRALRVQLEKHDAKK